MIKKVLVSQPQPTSEKSPYFDIARKLDVEIVFRPFIKVESLSAKEFRKQKIDLLSFTAVVFTSRHAIDHFFSFCKEMRIAVPETMKYFCITETVALYIQKYIPYRKRKIFFGTTGKMDDVLPAMLKHNTERFFIPQSEVHNDEVARLMDDNHLQHTEGVMYRTVSNDFSSKETFDYDMIVLFSPSGVHALTKNFPKLDQTKIQLATFGPATAQAVKDAGLRLDLEAPSERYPSMTAALCAYIAEANGKK